MTMPIVPATASAATTRDCGNGRLSVFESTKPIPAKVASSQVEDSAR